MKRNRLSLILLCLLVVSIGAVHADEEQDLIATLQSNAGIPQKCSACFRLRLVGTAKSVPALAALLSEARLSHAARNALEVMPYAEAGEALRHALAESSGPIKAGLIDSLGWRRDAQAVPYLAPLLSGTDAVMASAAASALGRIGTPSAAEALAKALAASNLKVGPALVEACLDCADRLQAAKDYARAERMYRQMLGSDLPGHLRIAALKGLAGLKRAVASDVGAHSREEAPGPQLGKRFKVHTINAESRFEAAGILDVNRDGELDIFCGGFWYEAPNWKKHFVREVKEQGNYHYDFANLPMDVDGDGWTDIANAAWHNKLVFWVRNPGEKGGPWEVIEIDTPGNMETAMTEDVNGDGQPDVLPNIMSQAAWYEFHHDASAPHGVRWEKHPLPQQAAGHGLGSGDVNGDGRCDIVTPKGWLEQLADGWQWHPEFELGHASIPILVHDVDEDGDADIIWGLGHNYGLFWLEQEKQGGQRSWEKHLIDDSWSQPHFLMLADLDNDEKDELITGKRYHAHNGNDPGGNDPVCVYYYDFDPSGRKWTRHTMHEGGRVGLGISTEAADMDGDGDIDVVAPGKSGLYLFENLGR